MNCDDFARSHGAVFGFLLEGQSRCSSTISRAESSSADSLKIDWNGDLLHSASW